MRKRIISLAASLMVTMPLLANNAENFREHDHWGLMMTIIAMGVVFSALLILFICFKWADKGINIIVYNLFIRPYKAMGDSALGKSLGGLFSFKSKRGGDIPYQSDLKIKERATGRRVDDGELAAAIGIALFLAEDGMHDAEADVLTMATQPAGGWTGVGQNQKRQPLRKF